MTLQINSARLDFQQIINLLYKSVHFSQQLDDPKMGDLKCRENIFNCDNIFSRDNIIYFLIFLLQCCSQNYRINVYSGLFKSATWTWVKNLKGKWDATTLEVSVNCIFDMEMTDKQNKPLLQWSGQLHLRFAKFQSKVIGTDDFQRKKKLILLFF